MRLKKLHIKNFRSFKDEVVVFEPYTCFVGPNGAGKSTVLTALNILFRYDEGPGSVTVLHEEDFHRKNTSEPIEITATFTGLSAAASEELKAYVRQGQLVVSAKAEWNPPLESAEVEQYGSRLVMNDFAKYFHADSSGAKAQELKQIYKDIREDYPSLPDEWVKADMKAALREYEENHPEECELIPSNDQFYGWSRGQNRLENYIQWVYIPAVKDASEEEEESRGSALGELLKTTIRKKVDFSESLNKLEHEISKKYKDILDNKSSALDEVSSSIQSRLRDWAHSGAAVDLVWNYDPGKSVSVSEPNAKVLVGEGEFIGEVMRAGHGMQRSFLVALLHELAAGENLRDTEPTLLIGIEEPELYQHPPQARHLADVLESLAQSNSQVLITTHSPHFISAKGFPSVRMTRRPDPESGTRVTGATLDLVRKNLGEALEDDPQELTTLMAKVSQIMRPSQRELFFSKVPVLVEGPEDIAYLSTQLQLAGQWRRFRRLGCHFVPCGGKNPMSRPLALALALEIPVFVVFDADRDEIGTNREENHRRDNLCLLRLLGCQEDPFPTEPLLDSRAVVWPSKIGGVVKDEVGLTNWEAAKNNTHLSQGVGDKNGLLITAILEKLWDEDSHSKALSQACECILDHAEKVNSPE